MLIIDQELSVYNMFDYEKFNRDYLTNKVIKSNENVEWIRSQVRSIFL